MALSGMTNFKNDWKTQALSKEIAIQYGNRGYSWAEKVQTVLNDLRQNEINSLKTLDQDVIREYVSSLAESVQNGEISAHTAQTYVSALNTIVDYTNQVVGTELNQVSAVEYGIYREIDYSNKAVSQEIHQDFLNFVSEKFEQIGDTRLQALNFAVELQREFGLRARESFGINQNTIEKGIQEGKLELGREDWTKNAREREIEIRTEEQKQLLTEVKNFIQENNTVNLAGAQDIKSFKEIAEFRSFADNVRNEFNKEFNHNYTFHAERHSWAQSQYSQAWQEKTGQAIQAPIKYYSEQLEKAGWDNSGKFYDAVKEYNVKHFYEYVREETNLSTSEIKEIDKEIRMQISEELGHSRLDVTNIYLGH